MSLWSGASGQLNAANMEKLGPWFDCVVGTDGKYTDLKAALDGGHKQIMLATGATLSADVTLSSGLTLIISPYPARALNIGNASITVNANYCKLQGFMLDGAGTHAGAGIILSGSASYTLLRDVLVDDFIGAGFDLATTGNENVLDCCESTGNGGDGVLVASGADYTRISNCLINNNGAYGVDDSAGGGSIIIGCNLRGNASGQVDPGAGTKYHADWNIT